MASAKETARDPPINRSRVLDTLLAVESKNR